MRHIITGSSATYLLFILCGTLFTATSLITPAKAITVEALYHDCKKALTLSEKGLKGAGVSAQDKTMHFMSFFKCGGYLNGALEMKRALNAHAKSVKPYCSPKKNVLNLTVAARLFIGFVEGGNHTKSQKPAATILLKALNTMLSLDSELAKKHGCFAG